MAVFFRRQAIGRGKAKRWRFEATTDAPQFTNKGLLTSREDREALREVAEWAAEQFQIKGNTGIGCQVSGRVTYAYGLLMQDGRLMQEDNPHSIVQEYWIEFNNELDATLFAVTWETKKKR